MLAAGTGGAPPPGMPRATGFGGGGTKRPSTIKVAKEFSQFLIHDAHQRNSALFSPAELLEAFNRSGLTQPKASWADFVEALNAEGIILKKFVDGKLCWSLQGSGLSMHGSQR